MRKINISGYNTYASGNTTLVIRKTLDSGIIPSKGPIGKASNMRGRGTIRILGDEMVVRELAHGGIFGKLTGRCFLSTSRSIREIKVSCLLRGHGVNTPEIIAVRSIKSGMFNTIDVITALVPDSVDLLSWLERPDTGQDKDLAKVLFHKTGGLVRKMHELNVYHADLHLKNILLDSNMNPWLLDLDRARRLPYLPRFLKEMNLRRFFRSCRKWSGKGRINLPSGFQQDFLEGYNG